MKFCKIINLNLGFAYATMNSIPISDVFKTYDDAFRAAVEAGYFVID